MKLYDNGNLYFEGTLDEYNALKAIGAFDNVGNKPTNPKTAKGKGKVEATVKDDRTWSEKKSAWAKEHYTDEERKAFGEAKKAERELQHKAYELTKEAFTEKVSYAEWKKKYNEILKSLKK